MILADTSGLLAALFPDQRRHAECAAVLREAEGPFILSPFVLAELDYLVAKFGGLEAELALLDEVARQAYLLADFTAEEVAAAAEIVERFGEAAVGLADASLVVLSRRYAARDVLTLDERHFRTLAAFDGRPFRLLPADRGSRTGY